MSTATSTYDGPRRPIHVCSLSVSVIQRISRQLKEEEELMHDHKYCKEHNFVETGREARLRILRLKWLNVAVEHNRKMQLRYVYRNLGDKGCSPAFRPVRMAQFWRQWKHESLRSDWAFFRECVDRHLANREINDKSNFLMSQRIEIAARTFLAGDVIKNLPIDDVVNSKPTEVLRSFVPPKAGRPGFLNQIMDFCESTQVASSTSNFVGTTTTTDDIDDVDSKTIEERFMALAAERGFYDAFAENQTTTMDSTTYQSDTTQNTDEVKERDVFILGDDDEVIKIPEKAEEVPARQEPELEEDIYIDDYSDDGEKISPADASQAKEEEEYNEEEDIPNVVEEEAVNENVADKEEEEEIPNKEPIQEEESVKEEIKEEESVKEEIKEEESVKEEIKEEESVKEEIKEEEPVKEEIKEEEPIKEESIKEEVKKEDIKEEKQSIKEEEELKSAPPQENAKPEAPATASNNTKLYAVLAAIILLLALNLFK